MNVSFIFLWKNSHENVEGAMSLWPVLVKALGEPYAHLARLPETLDLSKVESVDWEQKSRE